MLNVFSSLADRQHLILAQTSMTYPEEVSERNSASAPPLRLPPVHHLPHLGPVLQILVEQPP